MVGGGDGGGCCLTFGAGADTFFVLVAVSKITRFHMTTVVDQSFQSINTVSKSDSTISFPQK